MKLIKVILRNGNIKGLASFIKQLSGCKTQQEKRYVCLHQLMATFVTMMCRICKKREMEGWLREIYEKMKNVKNLRDFLCYITELKRYNILKEDVDKAEFNEFVDVYENLFDAYLLGYAKENKLSFNLATCIKGGI